MTSRGGKSQRREEKRRKRRSKKRKSQKKEDPGARKGRKAAKRGVFPMIWGSGGSKSRLAKAAGAEPAGQMGDETLHVVVARSTFPRFSKSKCTKHTGSDHFWMLKKCTPLWREAHFEDKMHKTHKLGATFGRWDVEKVHAVVVRSTCRSQKCKSWGVRSTFGRSDFVSRGRCQGFCTLPKWAKREGFVACPKTMAGVGHLKRICKDAFRVAGAIQETCSSEMLGGQGADFLRVVAFWSIRSSGLLRWFCVTGAACRMTWYHFFVAGAVV